MLDILFVALALPLAGWLLLLALDWWRIGAYHRRVAAFVTTSSLPEWRGRIEDARAHLADLQTPGWYDRAWPICDDLELSSDGEYCRRCYRQAHEHGSRICG